MLRLSGLDSDSMTDDQRDAFINMAENLGIDVDEAEDMVDAFLDSTEEAANGPGPVVTAAPPLVKVVSGTAASAAGQEVAEPPAPVYPGMLQEAEERAQFINFQNSLGGDMLFVPSGQFVMGSEASEAAPNEKPLTRVTLSRSTCRVISLPMPTTKSSTRHTRASAPRARATGIRSSMSAAWTPSNSAGG